MSDQNQAPVQNGVVADAVAQNWVDVYAPVWSRPFLRLSRADRPIGTWLLLLPCWWGLLLAMAAGTPQLFDLWIAVGCVLGAFLMRGAGCTWNDITDRHIDAQVARTRSRPLPSKQVSVRGALIWMGLQIGISALILLTFNGFTIVLAIAALIPVAIYPFAKRFTWWPQVFLGVAFNWGALVGWSAHTGSLSVAPVLLYLTGIVWTLFYDTIYAHQDTEDDALIGVKSTARLFGENSKKWLLGFIAGCGILLVLTFTRVGLEIALILGVVAFIAHLLWQWWQLDVDRPETCLRLFRSNKTAGLLLVVFLMWVALG